MNNVQIINPAQESDDSSGEENFDMAEDQTMAVKGNKPWVPAIEDPNYFEDLSPEEIYDSFFNIRRMGFIANRIIRKLNETKHIVSSKILEKRKKLKAVQRKQFEQLSPAGVEYLKVLLKMGKYLSHIFSFFSNTHFIPLKKNIRNRCLKEQCSNGDGRIKPQYQYQMSLSSFGGRSKLRRNSQQNLRH